MSELRTFKCLNCGATLTTTAAPGTVITCEFCGSPFTVPAQNGQSGDAKATSVANFVRRGNPSPMPPVGPDGEAPPTPEHPPAPDSPAGVGYTVDAEALQPAVERGPIDPSDPPLPAGADVTPPVVAAEDGPSPAELIAEPVKYGVAIPATEGEPLVVPPNRVKVIPPQKPGVGGPPGAALRSRSPALLAGGTVLTCCLLGTASIVVCVLSGLFTR